MAPALLDRSGGSRATEAEHNRVRDPTTAINNSSATAGCHKGYDEAADSRERTPDIDRIVDEP
jgi:hypothetical protein